MFFDITSFLCGIGATVIAFAALIWWDLDKSPLADEHYVD